MKPIREWTDEDIATLLHRADYGEAVAMHLERSGLDNKLGDYAVMYARVMRPLVLELQRLRALLGTDGSGG